MQLDISGFQGGGRGHMSRTEGGIKELKNAREQILTSSLQKVMSLTDILILAREIMSDCEITLCCC